MLRIADSVSVQRPGRRMAGTFRSPWSARPYVQFRFSRRWLIVVPGKLRTPPRRSPRPRRREHRRL